MKKKKDVCAQSMQWLWLSIWQAVQAGDKASLELALADHKLAFNIDKDSAKRAINIIELAKNDPVSPIHKRIDRLTENLNASHKSTINTAIKNTRKKVA